MENDLIAEKRQTPHEERQVLTSTIINHRAQLLATLRTVEMLLIFALNTSLQDDIREAIAAIRRGREATKLPAVYGEQV